MLKPKNIKNIIMTWNETRMGGVTTPPILVEPIKLFFKHEVILCDFRSKIFKIEIFLFNMDVCIVVKKCTIHEYFG